MYWVKKEAHIILTLRNGEQTLKIGRKEDELKYYWIRPKLSSQVGMFTEAVCPKPHFQIKTSRMNTSPIAYIQFTLKYTRVRGKSKSKCAGELNSGGKAACLLLDEPVSQSGRWKE